jgi:hypothetical protein
MVAQAGDCQTIDGQSVDQPLWFIEHPDGRSERRTAELVHTAGAVAPANRRSREIERSRGFEVQA